MTPPWVKDTSCDLSYHPALRPSTSPGIRLYDYPRPYFFVLRRENKLNNPIGYQLWPGLEEGIIHRVDVLPNLRFETRPSL